MARMILFLTLIIVGLGQLASAQSTPAGLEGCYIRVLIDQQFDINGQAQLVPISASILYGPYASEIQGVDVENPDSWQLRSVSSRGQVIDSFALRPRGILYFDPLSDVAPGPGPIQLDRTAIEAFVPYSSQIATLRIAVDGVEQPSTIAAPTEPCRVTCIAENQTGVFGTDRCCRPLLTRDLGGGRFDCR